MGHTVSFSGLLVKKMYKTIFLNSEKHEVSEDHVLNLKKKSRSKINLIDLKFSQQNATRIQKNHAGKNQDETIAVKNPQSHKILAKYKVVTCN
jgi:hypothetical protein